MALDAAETMRSGLGIDPDQWQANFLRSTANKLLLLCARQCGKSTVTAVMALHTALFEPGSLVLLLSPSQRQSGELFGKVTGMNDALGRPVPAETDSATTLALENGSRVVSLPGSPKTVRGFSGARLLVIDEAALTGDDLFTAVSPMLAVSRGRLVALSTPMGKRGWFHDQWTHENSSWQKIKATAWDCPRVSREFLEEERKTLGDRWFRQEYECSFEETMDQVFSTDSILAAFDSDETPLFGG